MQTATVADRRASLMHDMRSVLERCHFLLLKDYAAPTGNDKPVVADVRSLFDELCEVLARAKAEGS